MSHERVARTLRVVYRCKSASDLDRPVMILQMSHNTG